MFQLKTGRIEKATKDSAAFDLFYNGTIPMFIDNEPIPIPTGVTTWFSKELVCIIKEKSGLALKGVEVKAGVIDSDFKDEWKVIMTCPHPTGYKVMPGQKIAQFLILRLPFVALEGEGIIIKEDERSGGFGSTGK